MFPPTDGQDWSSACPRQKHRELRKIADTVIDLAAIFGRLHTIATASTQLASQAAILA
jgi:hypothetical protein